ncbi:TetR family transcriptional regulator [Murinocardiopsis flavida]|uniref:TetR family transcriptional regulator n=1 Tax=Murinocardiopsis flavida TaxID=645275 RepID=A0A2P8DDX2_9ACTN|nr:TetR/AcrR family transcriptional regulator [Murinocardiopsis flavida]PSK95395.1 TetR family transcriptional regulator [Murinocardiopsis flavida]
MPRPRSQSRQRIVASAQVLLRRQGYQGTGLSQIIDASGAPRGSVYYLFPGGKEQIAVEAVAASAVEFDHLIGTAFDATDSLPEWIGAMARHFTESLDGTGYRDGCPITTITLDSVPGSAALTDACRAAYETWAGSLTRALAHYGVPGTEARSIALFILTSLEGSLVLCRAYQSTDPLTDAARHILTVLAPYTR